jgi:gliding motility-associated-like protein
LPGGTYEVTARDANDCEVKEIIWINVPLAVSVSLGDDQVIAAGDSTLIEAMVNVPYDSLASISWTGVSNPNCPTCLTQPVAPIITTTYSVSVTSVDGCADEDAMTIYLQRRIDIYIPNIFSPNGDNINDRLVISAGADVEEISSMIIFDRWGNMVYSADHFSPNDLSHSWDGTLKGQLLNPGVFAYRLIAKYRDGTEQIRYGDVTMIR